MMRPAGGQLRAHVRSRTREGSGLVSTCVSILSPDRDWWLGRTSFFSVSSTTSRAARSIWSSAFFSNIQTETSCGSEGDAIRVSAWRGQLVQIARCFSGRRHTFCVVLLVARRTRQRPTWKGLRSVPEASSAAATEDDDDWPKAGDEASEPCGEPAWIV